MTRQPAVALTTTEPQLAAQLARSIVHAGLAACVQVVPQIRSFYIWDGAVQDDGEALLLIKTDLGLSQRLIDHINAVHSYEVPELLFLKVDDGLPSYLDWMADVLSLR
ncbi:MAG: divalent-cation tolerance protein CutA [Spirochaetaceae bacterium]|nr:MAG: divalent-cation tolerance protein CutA [Spirochaetaceae bacterium]